jgi:hypothetical protein
MTRSTGRGVRESIIRRGLIVVLLVAVLLVPILVLPLPKAVVRQVVLWSDSWILTDFINGGHGRFAHATNAGQKTLATLLQYSLVTHFRRNQVVPEGASDPERMMAYLVPLKKALLSQTSVPHAASSWPVMLSGLGWCDQVNGVAAILLAAEFPSVQMIGMVDSESGAGHTVGRVWSPEMNDWLYYDIWGDEVVVFSVGDDGNADYIGRASPMPHRAPSAENAAVLHRLYNQTRDGFVFNEFRRTFGGYLLFKLRTAWTSRTLESIAPPSVALTEAGFVGGSSALAPEVFSGSPRTTRAYLEARLDHLLGDPSRGRRGYQAVAQQEAQQSTVLGRAAQLFLEQY